ncbi:hypothetical protein IAR55_002513 [Kwoniella newhampshirensis]|uniref:SET domain-containing protein n=1 Tax=Kwoniella newhampshirensis TaxID=1651941 RepID=A0AAW0Z1N5_9TREE
MTHTAAVGSSRSSRPQVYDVSQGSEPCKIPAVGLTADQLDTALSVFHTYIPDSKLSNGISLGDTAAARQHSRFKTLSENIEHDDQGSDGSDYSENETWSCTCMSQGGVDDQYLCTAKDGDACDCVSEFGNFYSSLGDDSKRQLLKLDALPDRLPLVECSPECACRARCANRVSQLGVRAPLTVRPAVSGIGLGLFFSPATSVDLPKGTFISLYAGEYLTTVEARTRWKDQQSLEQSEGQGNYILSLKLPGETIHIDPRHRGNVGRFLNHSCDPNCVVHVVRWGAGQGWPRAATYTKRYVKPGEELTFDYANASGGPWTKEAKGDEHNDKRTRCLCGSTRCRGWMPYDETL